jgi:spore coat protein H
VNRNLIHQVKLASYFLIAFLVHANFALTQNINPGVDEVFRPDEVAEIRITLAPEDKAFLLAPENRYSEEYKQAYFTMTNSQFNVTLSTAVGIRLRGNTSRGHDKKGFKIDFREYGGSKFKGYKKFNLKPDVNDPSMIRELLTLQYYREMNVPAARTHHVSLYMNEEYMGIYLNVEQIDDEFLNLRHGHEEGFLYKCSFGANLLDNGQVFNTALYESELNEDDDTRAELDHFVDVLNNSLDAQFAEKIEEVFDVEGYLRQLAVESLLGHWDGYSFNMNNYYLFYNGQTGLMEFFPYDTDNTWGIDWGSGHDWAKEDLNYWYKNFDTRPLTARILEVESYRDQYNENLVELITLYFNEEYLLPLLEQYKTLLDPFVANDTYFDNSFGFTLNDFRNSFYTHVGSNHVKYGLKEYLEVRTAYALTQIPGLITGAETDLRNEVHMYPNPSAEPSIFVCSSSQTFQTPVVYHVSGMQIPVEVRSVDENCHELVMPSGTSKGLYFVNVDGVVRKWVYQ